MLCVMFAKVRGFPKLDWVSVCLPHYITRFLKTCLIFVVILSPLWLAYLKGTYHQRKSYLLLIFKDVCLPPVQNSLFFNNPKISSSSVSRSCFSSCCFFLLRYLRVVMAWRYRGGLLLILTVVIMWVTSAEINQVSSPSLCSLWLYCSRWYCIILFLSRLFFFSFSEWCVVGGH